MVFVGPAYAKGSIVKKVVFRVAQGKSGFIRTILSPCNEKRDARFGWGDVVTLMALVIGILALARIILAH